MSIETTYNSDIAGQWNIILPIQDLKTVRDYINNMLIPTITALPSYQTAANINEHYNAGITLTRFRNPIHNEAQHLASIRDTTNINQKPKAQYQQYHNSQSRIRGDGTTFSQSSSICTSILDRTTVSQMEEFAVKIASVTHVVGSISERQAKLEMNQPKQDAANMQQHRENQKLRAEVERLTKSVDTLTEQFSLLAQKKRYLCGHMASEFI